jgi:uroporphyrinogen-III synthase
MNIIITRPEEDGEALAAKLRKLGHNPMPIPLITIVPRANIVVPKKTYQAICLTSANGVRSLRSIIDLENTPVIAVGAHSLEAAHQAGFKNAIAKGGDVDGLSMYVLDTFKQSAGPILYISGSETSGDLEGKLKLAGFKVDRLITYDAVPAKLAGRQFDLAKANAVMLYSPRSAKIWRSEVEQLNVDISHINHICLSANVAAALPQSWTKNIAPHPTEQDIIATLDYKGKAE